MQSQFTTASSLVMRAAAADTIGSALKKVPKTPTGELGELIVRTFAAHDLLLDMRRG